MLKYLKKTPNKQISDLFIRHSDLRSLNSDSGKKERDADVVRHRVCNFKTCRSIHFHLNFFKQDCCTILN
jgi:hypothetical protein